VKQTTPTVKGISNCTLPQDPAVWTTNFQLQAFPWISDQPPSILSRLKHCFYIGASTGFKQDQLASSPCEPKKVQ
jgi:hypothetical protein